jgi:hypothetical protein
MSIVSVVNGSTPEAELVKKESGRDDEERGDSFNSSEPRGAPSETKELAEEAPDPSEASGAPAETKMVVAGSVSVTV